MDDTMTAVDLVPSLPESRDVADPRPARLRGAATAALGLVLALAPFMLGDFGTATLTRILAFAVLCVSAQLLIGLAGLPTLGQTLYFGVGAYASAILAVNVTTNGPLLVLMGGVAGLLAAVLTGWIAVRVSGIVFLMLTLAVGQLSYQVAVTWKSVTFGSDGFVGIPYFTLLPDGGLPLLDLRQRYWFVLAMVIVVLLVVWVFTRSPFGRTADGLRENESRLRALGYTAWLCRYIVFAFAGGVAGVGGALWVSQAQFFSPDDMNFGVMAIAFVAVVVGGRRSFMGAAAGAAIVLLVRDFVGTHFAGHGNLLLGVMFLLVVYLMPQGVSGLASALARKVLPKWPVEKSATP
jgi:branched-chain amino acid transport system permease protein